MKKLLYVFTAACFLSGVVSCMEIDNFEGPDASIEGRIIDKTTGLNMMFDQADTHIRTWETSYSDNPNPWDIVVKADGTYKNTKLFSGTYDMMPLDGAYWPCEKTKGVIISKRGTVQDFEVTPYLHVVDFKAELNGTSLTLSCRLQAPIPQGLPQILEIRPFINNNEHVGYANHLVHYYTDKYTIPIKKYWDSIGDKKGESSKVYSITVDVKPGYHYWVRMGVQVNNAWLNYNYSEVQEIVVPN